MDVIHKKDKAIYELEVQASTDGQISDNEDFLIEEKAKRMLKICGYGGAFRQIAKGLFRMGDQLVCLKLKKGGLENILIARFSKNVKALNKLTFVEGQHNFFEFEKAVTVMIKEQTKK